MRTSLAELKSLSGILKIQPSRETFAFSAWKDGIPRGAITEISGPPGCGKSEAILRFLAENPKLRAAWIEEQLTAYPCAFPQQGVGLDRVLFAEPGEQTLWATHQILRSGIFAVVILASSPLKMARRHPDQDVATAEMNLRRLQLAAEQANASLILLVEEPISCRNWAISLRLQVIRKADSVVIRPWIPPIPQAAEMEEMS